MATNNNWNNAIAAANSAITLNSGTNTVSISTDASATTVNIATGGAVKTSTFGSTNSTSATTVQSGSGALNVTSTNGALTVNSGTGALGISTDASATTVSFATGGAVKTVTLGSTNTTSSTAIKSGTGNVAINSGLTVDSTGRMTNGVQPAFSAYKSSASTNVTGDGTTYTVICDTEFFDIGSNFNNSTGIFTAPVSGIYMFTFACMITGIGAAHTTYQLQVVTPTNAYQGAYCSPTACKANGNFLESNMAIAIQLSATNTVTFSIVVAGSTKTVGVNGGGPIGAQQFTYVSGYLVA